MNKYLLDTNIVIFLFRQKFQIREKIALIGLQNCSVSEITLAELKIGAESSADPAKNHALINLLTETVTVLPISKVLDVFASEKVRLNKAGTPMHDHFDVLIAATAMVYNLVLVTNNTKHFVVYEGLEVEDWTLSDPARFV
ncbi:PIN domain-containing protein [Haliscomenobacter sp.]|uniref:PIN domain-containing protein n=1 Tax=Haliscomenobacter sp. TaxID=2717303 RepID=UPI003364F097